MIHGTTYDPAKDELRLFNQAERVRNLMMDGKKRSLGEIAQAVKGSEASVSARLRDLRNQLHYNVKKERFRDSGLWLYWIEKEGK